MEENLKEELDDGDMDELTDKMSRAVLAALQKTMRESGKHIGGLDRAYLVSTSVSSTAVAFLLAPLPKHLREKGLGDQLIEAFVAEVYEKAKYMLDELRREDSHVVDSSSPVPLEDLFPIGPVQ